MKFHVIDNRLRKLEPPPIIPANQEEAEHARILQECYEKHLIDHLNELGLAHLADEVTTTEKENSALDDPMLEIAQQLEDAHPELVYLIKSAALGALADVFIELGDPEDPEDFETVKKFKASAAENLMWDRKHKQTFCDICGNNLSDWSCYTSKRDEVMIKVCKKCSLSSHSH